MIKISFELSLYFPDIGVKSGSKVSISLFFHFILLQVHCLSQSAQLDSLNAVLPLPLLDTVVQALILLQLPVQLLQPHEGAAQQVQMDGLEAKDEVHKS